MGNFKPQPHHYVEMNGRRRVLITEDIEILTLLKDGYWVEQNITSPRAIWLKHHAEREQPNITWNTFDKLTSKKLIKEHGTLHPIARFTITKQGEMEYQRLTKPVPIPPDMDVSPKPPVTAFEGFLKASDRSLIEQQLKLEQQLKTSVGVVAHSTTRVQNLYILNVIFDDYLQLLKAEAMLRLTPNKSEVAEQPKTKRRATKKFETAFLTCHYCKRGFTKKKASNFKEKVWHRACDECATRDRQAEYKLFKQIYGRFPTENDT